MRKFLIIVLLLGCHKVEPPPFEFEPRALSRAVVVDAQTPGVYNSVTWAPVDLVHMAQYGLYEANLLSPYRCGVWYTIGSGNLVTVMGFHFTSDHKSVRSILLNQFAGFHSAEFDGRWSTELTVRNHRRYNYTSIDSVQFPSGKDLTPRVEP